MTNCWFYVAGSAPILDDPTQPPEEHRLGLDEDEPGDGDSDLYDGVHLTTQRAVRGIQRSKFNIFLGQKQKYKCFRPV